MKPTAQYYEGIDGKWYVRIVSANGKVVLDSQGYTRKWNAKRAAKKAASIFGLEVVEVKGKTKTARMATG